MQLNLKPGEQAAKIITVTVLSVSYCTRLTEGWHVQISQPLNRFSCVYSSVKKVTFLKTCCPTFNPLTLVVEMPISIK